MIAATRTRTIRAVGEAAFLTGVVVSPWVGLGVVHAVTDHDLGAGMQPAYLAFAVAALCLLLDPGRRGDLLHPWRGWWGAALAVLLLSGAGLIAAPGDVPAATAWARLAKQVVQWLVMAVIALTAASHLAAADGRRRALVALAVAVGIQLLYGVGQTLHFRGAAPWFGALEHVFTSNPAILSGSEELYLGHAFTGVPRVRGTACEPLYLAGWTLLALPPLLAASARRRLWLLPAAAAAGLLAATWSRGAWLAAGGALLTGAWLAHRAGVRPTRRGLLIGLGAATAGTALLALLSGPETPGLILDRLRQSLVREDWSNLTRLYSMQAGWRVFLLSPVVGVGWGQFAFHFHRVVDPAGLQAQFDWPVVNNLPLEILCETGIVGFAVFIAAVVVLGRRVLRAAGDASLPTATRVLVAAGGAAAVGVWLQLLTYSQYNLPHVWLATGLLLAGLRTAEDGEAAS